VKRLLVVFLALTMVLTGCFGGSDSKEKNSNVGLSEASPKLSTNDGVTVFDLKKKYGSESNKSLMPMYNVARDEVFTFKFKAKFDKELANDIITVHTDIKALEKSEILTFRNFIDPMSRDAIEVKSVGGVLLSTDTGGYEGQSWGNAPVYYVRINYDLGATTPTKLEKPIIVPFTIKSELPSPTLKHEIDANGKFKLTWNKVEGATSYKVYQRSTIVLLDTVNLPVSGPEEGYVGGYPHLIREVKETQLSWFLSTFDPEKADDYVTYQNQGVNGEYYVTAVNGAKESNFSNVVSTVKLSSSLPKDFVDNIGFARYANTSLLPKKATVKLIDGSIITRDIVFGTTKVEIKEFGGTHLNYSVKGTDFKGYVLVEKITTEDIKKLGVSQETSANTGYVEPNNTTDYVPAPDIPTVIDVPSSPAPSTEPSTTPNTKHSIAPSTEPSTTPNTKHSIEPITSPTTEPSSSPTTDSKENVVEQQKENTKKQVDDGNKQSIPKPEITSTVKVNADSALEEYLAVNLIDAQNKISLKAFPEAQNAEALMDAMDKVVYQNPMILGVSQYGYDYKALSLSIVYNDSPEVIKTKQKEIIAESKKIVTSTIKDGMSDEAKRKALYDYLNDNTKYDKAALKSAEASNFKNVGTEFNDSFTTYGIMVKKVGVCMSYAYTFKMLGDLAGVETVVVTGALSGVPHAWNKVKIGTEWLNVDSTNGLTNAGVPYLLYNANDKTAKSLDFESDKSYWLDSEIPSFVGVSDANDYYVVNGLEVDSVAKYKSKLAELLKKGNPLISLRLAGKVTPAEVAKETGKVISDNAPDKLKTAEMSGLGTYVIIKP
jgi:hypothetical protein